MLSALPGPDSELSRYAARSQFVIRRDEHDDGLATIAWIKQQECSQASATLSGSYLGFVQGLWQPMPVRTSQVATAIARSRGTAAERAYLA